MVKTFSQSDTIYALASGLGKSAIAVVRISGPACSQILEQLCPRKIIRDREATLTTLYNDSGEQLDRAIIVRFFSPRSFTGEEMVEFQVTGSRAVVSDLVKAISACPGTRPAEPGEFAWRAFLNGKLDLVEIEGLASVVEAETSAQLRHAMSMASGRVSQAFEAVNLAILRATAAAEALLDFSDVEDADVLSTEDILVPVREAIESLMGLLAGSQVAERLQTGLLVAIAGPPNVGKSTLLNYLARREIAIVSPIPGTTRDSLEVSTDLAGYPVTFVDTAGIRETSDPIERLGIARSRERCASADFVIWLFEGDFVEPSAELLERPALFVRAKADVAANLKWRGLSISARTGGGIENLIGHIKDFATEHFLGADELTLGTARQRSAARAALEALQRINDSANAPLELVAEDLRFASAAMGRVVGRIGLEDVLDQIFSRLCVGK